MDSQASFRRTVAGLVAVSIVLAFAASADAAYPGRNGKIAFSSNQAGNYDVYTINPDGTGVTRLTDNLQQDLEPKFSPDGSKIAFIRLDPVGSAYNVWLMNADGSGQQFLARARILQPASTTWSPDGTQLLVTGSSGLDNLDLNGRWTRGRAVPNISTDPAWSPDGATIAFANLVATESELYSFPSQTAAMAALTATPDVFETNPAWSPDSRRIVYDDARHLPGDSTACEP